MNHSHRFLFTIVLAIFLFAVIPAYAQEEKSAPSKEEIAALREKALKLLDTVAGQLNTLQSTENRARMGANLADSLWKHDEDRARALLRMVQEDIKTELQTRDNQTRHDLRFQVFLKLRRDTVERIAKHDGQAAYDLLKVTEPVFQHQEPYDFRQSEHALELQLAKQIAANSPEMALKLARQSLRQGFSSDAIKVLNTLSRKHKEHAQLLYKEIVDKFSRADFVENWNTREFALMLVQSYEPPVANEATYRELIGLIVKKALDQGCGKGPSGEEDSGAYFCQWAAITLNNAEAYDSRVARIKSWSSGEIDSWKFNSVHEELRELAQKGDYHQVEELATKHPGFAETIYSEAIVYAMGRGELDEARKMALRLPNDERRQELLRELGNDQKLPAIPVEKLAEVRADLNKIPNDRARAEAFLVVATKISVTDKTTGAKFLEHAREIIDSMKPGKEQTEARVSLAIAYCQHNNDRGFTIMESLLPKLNELVDVAAKLDGYDTNYLRDGEWNMSANGSVGEILTILSEFAGAFAWSDFDRAVTLASQFERPEIRLMAQLKLAQSILAGPPQRFPWFRNRYIRFR